MVKVELSYNPYLLETIVKFNGQLPKINSLVEKYQEGKLDVWMDMLPEIFCDEMNGYDFELEYSGVKSDFESLKDAFKSAGVEGEQVKFFFKNELENINIKCQRIEIMFEWLKDNVNRRMDYAQFISDNQELLDETYTYIVIGTKDFVSAGELDKKRIMIETVKDATELKEISVSNTPLLIYVDEDWKNSLSSNLNILLKRDDISTRQLFFYIHPRMNVTQIERVIRDLGISSPNVVKSFDDKAILSYLEIYSISDHIKNVLDVVRNRIELLAEELKNENEKSIVINSEIHKKIDELESEIQSLKIADDNVLQRDYLDLSDDFQKARNSLVDAISGWKRKKIKITGEDEAKNVAKDFQSDLERWFGIFLEEVDYIVNKKVLEIEEFYEELCQSTKLEEDFSMNVDMDLEEVKISIPNIENELLLLHEKKYVEVKEDFFSSLFGGNEDKDKELVLQITFYYEEWRKKVWEVISPIVDKILSDRGAWIVSYYNDLAERYHNCFISLIDNRNIQKDDVAKHLSDDERQLQEDNDWLQELMDIVSVIERG